MKNASFFPALLLVFSIVSLEPVQKAHAGDTSLISLNSQGEPADNYTYLSAISADGQVVAFSSWATNLVPDDTNDAVDVFVHDRASGQTWRVSVSSTGVQGNNFSYLAGISADGRYVLFSSGADNLVPGKQFGFDVFVYDRITGSTERINTNAKGEPGNQDSFAGAISADGRFVAFSTESDNLVANDRNQKGDAFVRDRLTGKVSLVSVSSSGKQGNALSAATAISADGRYVAFDTHADNFVKTDTNGTVDSYVHDRVSGKTQRVSLNSSSRQVYYPCHVSAISGDARYLALNYAGHIFLRQRLTGKHTFVSSNSTGESGNNLSISTAISADGRFVAFDSYSDNLAPLNTICTDCTPNSFVYDRLARLNSLVNISSNDTRGNAASEEGSISADGRFVAFASGADNLDPNFHNGGVFVRDRLLDNNHNADLQVTGKLQTPQVKKHHIAKFIIEIRNAGPDIATETSLIHIVSLGKIIRMKTSQGKCRKAAISICRFGSLEPGATAVIKISIKSETKLLSQRISANALPKDNAPNNNSITISTPMFP